MNFSDIKIKVNIKAICYFEYIRNKSFFQLTEEDIPYLLYSGYLEGGNGRITFEQFAMLMNNRKFADHAANEYLEAMKFISQFQSATKSEDSKEVSMSITEIATTLIIEYHMDVNYVNYQMELWELTSYAEAVQRAQKNEMRDKRLWTYLTIMPHIDSKKIKSPEDLLPFEWEKKDIKERKQKDLKNNEYAMKHTIGMTLNI